MCDLISLSLLLDEDKQNVHRYQLLSVVYEKHVLGILRKPSLVHVTPWVLRISCSPKRGAACLSD
uniref:Uncharacterized protein n=1 Tax=Lepeophtheirus salmonis TaxID=72036 RepID=A0A0K2TFX1_LEPSM